MINEIFDRSVKKIPGTVSRNQIENFLAYHYATKICISKLPKHDPSGQAFKSGLITDILEREKTSAFVNTEDMIHIIRDRMDATVDAFPNHRIAYWIKAHIDSMHHRYFELPREAAQHVNNSFRKAASIHPLPMLADYVWEELSEITTISQNSALERNFSKSLLKRWLGLG